MSFLFHQIWGSLFFFKVTGQVFFFEVHSGEAKCTLFHISWYYITASLSYSFGKSYCSEDQLPECKLVSNINSELKLQVKMVTVAYSCHWAWQEIYFAVAEK